MLRIAIIGGGPGGLTLARLLQMQGAAVRVYEADATPEARSQGGSLDLHEDSGQLALNRAGLEAEFRRLSRPEGQHFVIYDQHGVRHFDYAPAPGTLSRPEIDRRLLRDLLLGSLAPDTLCWGRRLRHVEPGPPHRLVFETGPAEMADLVIGCDGAWSRVRSLISQDRPAYVGVTFVETRLADADRRHPVASRLVGPGSLMSAGENKALMAQRNGDGDIRIYAALRVPEDWSQRAGIDFADGAAAKRALLGLFAGWASPLLDLLRCAEDQFRPWPLITLPPEQDWRACPGVTLLGDAAHVMPPFTGRGANLAMLDAVELAEALGRARPGETDGALRAYEAAMLARMAPAIRETLAAEDAMIAPDAPAPLLARMRGRLGVAAEG